MEPISAPAHTPSRSRWTSRTFSMWRILARMFWFTVVLLTLFQLVVSFPGRYAQFTSVCPSCLLRSDNIEELRTLGLSSQEFAIYLLVLAALFTLIYCLVGATIMWRKIDDPLAVLVAFALLFFGGFASWGLPDPLVSGLPFGYALARVISAVGRALLLLMFFLFPDGRFAPRLVRIPALLGVAVVTAFSLAPLEILPPWLTAIGIVLSAAAFVGAVLCQVYRYSKRSSTAQREQTKWIVFGIGVAIGAQILELAALYVIGPRIWLE